MQFSYIYFSCDLSDISIQLRLEASLVDQMRLKMQQILAADFPELSDRWRVALGSQARLLK